MGNAKKISDEQFLSVLRENGGLFARTARAIEKQFNIKYSRQAVRDKADNFPEELLDIAEENLDIAEEGLLSIMRSKNEQVRLRAIELYLKTKGKKRGYIERQEITGAGGRDLNANITIELIDSPDKVDNEDSGC